MPGGTPAPCRSSWGGSPTGDRGPSSGTGPIPAAPPGWRTDRGSTSSSGAIRSSSWGRTSSGPSAVVSRTCSSSSPPREHAAESFAAENAAGLALDSPTRNYRDDNHKPELVLALSRFEAVCGFRAPRRAAQILEQLGTPLSDRLHSLLVANPSAHGMRAAFRTLIAPTLRPDAVAVEEVVAACARRVDSGTP